MKFVMYVDCVSPHQLPLARELVKRLGAENFRYVYRDQEQGDRVKLGWQMAGSESWFVHIGSHPTETHDLIENAGALLTGMREPDLFVRRCAKGLKTFYSSERWFKPILTGDKLPHLFPIPYSLFPHLPGWLKLLSPSYFKTAWQIARLLKTQPNFYYLPIGPHAARDMRLLGVPASKMIPWGYFVAPSDKRNNSTVDLDLLSRPSSTRALRVLYVGRFLALKRIDTIIRAVAAVAKRGKPITLTLVGSGPEESKLKKLANSIVQPSTFNLQPVVFLPPVPIHEVRPIMRQHDVLVFASNAFDGWGAVVNEALSEGIAAIGTYETGAAPALLPNDYLFHCGDWCGLADKLSALPLHRETPTLPRAYTPEGACNLLLNCCYDNKEINDD